MLQILSDNMLEKGLSFRNDDVTGAENMRE